MKAVAMVAFDKFRTLLLAVPVVLALGGCASTDPQSAFRDVQGTVQDRLGQQLQWTHDAAANADMAQAITEYLSKDLTASSAVAVALLNNRSLQAEFEELGISQAELSKASRLNNPEIIGSWRFPDRPPSAVDMEYSVAFDFLNLLSLPARTRIASLELDRVKLQVADKVLKLAGEVQAAFYTLQARQQLVAELETTAAISAAAAEFARRQHDAGNINDLSFHNQQAADAQRQLELARAKAQVLTDREKLNRLLSLSRAQTSWKITVDLSPIPEKELPLADLESLAITQRLDLAASFVTVQTLASALHLQENTRWIPGLTLGVDTERQTDGQIITGPFLGLELPIFDQGQPALAKLAAQYRQAERRYEGQAIDIRSEVRDASDTLKATREAAAFYQNVLLPQRQQIARETLLQYNAMQISSYELLAARENEQVAKRGYIEALRDYWIAHSVLERTVGGRLDGTALSANQSMSLAPPMAENQAHP